MTREIRLAAVLLAVSVALCFPPLADPAPDPDPGFFMAPTMEMPAEYTGFAGL